MSRRSRSSRKLTPVLTDPNSTASTEAATPTKPRRWRSRRQLTWWKAPLWRMFLLGSQINRRAILIVAGGIAAVALLYFPASYLHAGFLRRAAIAQAHKLADDGNPERASMILGELLADWPDDVEILSYQSALMEKCAVTVPQLLQSEKLLDHLIKLDPDSPARQEDRKRLIRIWLRIGDIVKAASIKIPALAKQESRFGAARKLVEELIKLGGDDAETYQLQGMILERLAQAGEVQSLPVAIKAYQKALRRDPGDATSAERLASIRLERNKDQAGADRILEDMVKARPRSLEARLARCRFFLKTNREERAKSELDAASRLAPTDTRVRATAATLAIRRGDIASARRHIQAIPEAERQQPRIVLLTGEVEYADGRPDEAIKLMRRGLVQTSGTDADLTWRLAHLLILLDRTSEARPLMAQYRRLVGKETDPMVCFLAGILKERNGLHSAALVELEPVREEIPAEWKAYLEMTMGRCLETTGDAKLAEAAYQKARDLRPSWPAPRLALASLFSKSEPDRAESELENGIRVARGEASLYVGLARLEIARQLALPADRRRWSAVESALERGRKAAPGDPDLACASGDYLAASGHRAEALAELDTATRGAGKTKPEAWLAFAGMLASDGRGDEAIRVLEEAAGPKAAGDLATIRIARSKLLFQTGRGRLALEILGHGTDSLPLPERSALAKAKAELLLKMGDRPGSVATCRDWAEMVPEQTGPGLMLIEMARQGGTPEELELGLELLQKAGGEDDPQGLTTRVMAILASGKHEDEIEPARLDEAESMVKRLNELAPGLPSTTVARALLLERTRSYEEAISEYKLAIKRDTTGTALSRLVSLLTHLKRTEELTSLRTESPDASKIDRIAAGSAIIDGDKEQAEVILERLVEAQPDSWEYRSTLARLLGSMGKPEEAEAALNGLIARQPESPRPWLALLSSQVARGDKEAASSTIARLKRAYKGKRSQNLLASCLWASGDATGAASVLDETLTRNPDDLETIRVASRLNTALGRNDRAEELLRRALKNETKPAWAARQLASILVGRPGSGNWVEAWSLIGTPVAGRPDTPEDRLARAFVLQNAPDPARRPEALSILSALAGDLPTLDPTALQARVRLATLLMGAADYASAASAIAPVSGLPEVTDPTILGLAIEAMALAGRLEEARDTFERLAKADPDSPVTVYGRALILKAEGNADEAGAVLEAAALASEKSADAEKLSLFYFERLAFLKLDEAAERLGRKIARLWPRRAGALGGFLAGKGRVEEALKACRVAAEAGASREPFLAVVGLGPQARLEGKQAEQARALVVSLASRELSNIAIITQAGSFLHRQGRLEDEANLYRKAIQADPKNVVVRNNLAWALSENLNRPAEGLAEVDIAILQAGPSPQARDTRGVILVRLGRFDEAIAELESATKADPSAIHHLHLSRAYAGKGRVLDARKTLEGARKAGGDPRTLEPEDVAELAGSNGADRRPGIIGR